MQLIWSFDHPNKRGNKVLFKVADGKKILLFDWPKNSAYLEFSLVNFKSIACSGKLECNFSCSFLNIHISLKMECGEPGLSAVLCRLKAVSTIEFLTFKTQSYLGGAALHLFEGSASRSKKCFVIGETAQY